MNGKPDELVVVNLQPAQTTPLTRTTAVVNSAALQGAVNIACRFFTDTQIGCAVDTTDGSFTTLTLDQTADPDPAKYTFTINNVVGITSAVPVNTLAIAHSFEYTVVFAQKKQGYFILPDTVAIVYKKDPTKRFQYAGVDIDTFPIASQVTGSFFCDSQTSFVIVDGKSIKLHVYNIDELAVRFVPALLADVSGVLRVSNTMVGSQMVDVDLKSIFKPQVFYVPPPPPEPTPLWKYIGGFHW